MKYITLTDLKNYLNNNNELSNEIIELFKKFDNVKEYYTSKLIPNSENILFEDYKKKIINEFYPEKGDPKLRYSLINKLISDYKKISNNIKYVSDLYLCIVENGIKFTDDYGDIDENFYDFIENKYEKFLEILNKNNLLEEYKEKNELIYKNSRDFGWGFSDSIEETYFSFY